MVAIDANAPELTSNDVWIRSTTEHDPPAIAELFSRTIGRYRFRRGGVVDASILPGLVAVMNDRVVGATTFVGHGGEAEIVGIATEPGADSVFGALVDSSVTSLRDRHRRVFTVTTNVDFGLQASLMRSGFRLVAARAGSIAAARSSLPAGRIPESIDGIIVADELEFEWMTR